MRQWVKDRHLQKSLEEALKSFGHRLGTMGIALVDLCHRSTNRQSEGHIRYAGVRDQAQIFVASLAKLSIMFAAYHLLEKVQQAVSNLQSKKEDVWPSLTAAWEPLIANKIPHLSTHELPKFDRIFSLQGGPGHWDVSFTDQGIGIDTLRKLHETATDENNRRVNLGEVGKTMSFLDRLTWAVGAHENVGASLCIHDLGLQYIQGALMSEGLGDSEGHGFWLGGDYSGHHVRLGIKRPPKTPQSATAAVVADFLTRLETDQLLSSESNRAMISMMKLTGSWFGEGLSWASKSPSSIYNRVGHQTVGTESADDCAVIEQLCPGSNGLMLNARRAVARFFLIRYAAVGLGASDPQVLRDLIVKLDDVIEQENALRFEPREL
jgi:hypothetical protein